jgi:2-polyprenyl-3-methyl-5-hydroxy-6-metoxy-1,4-benzoquinol methylase
MLWNNYWESRKHMPYYWVVGEWLKELTKDKKDSLLDIGCGGCPISKFGSFNKRISLNLEPFTPIPDVENIACDWLEYDSPKVSVITCLQVLEHLTNDILHTFVEKIFSHCEIAIISVPHNWEKGLCEDHIQDPISITKFISMINREPIKIEISYGRIVAMFTGDIKNIINIK